MSVCHQMRVEASSAQNSWAYTRFGSTWPTTEPPPPTVGTGPPARTYQPTLRRTPESPTAEGHPAPPSCPPAPRPRGSPAPPPCAARGSTTPSPAPGSEHRRRAARPERDSRTTHRPPRSSSRLHRAPPGDRPSVSPDSAPARCGWRDRNPANRAGSTGRATPSPRTTPGSTPIPTTRPGSRRSPTATQYRPAPRPRRGRRCRHHPASFRYRGSGISTYALQIERRA